MANEERKQTVPYHTANTVRDLLNILSKYPPDTALVSCGPDCGGYDVENKDEVTVQMEGGRLFVGGL